MLAVRKLMMAGARIHDIVLAAQHTASSGTATSVTGTLPAGGYAGCHLIAVVGINASATISTPSGWTKAFQGNVTTTPVAVYTRPWASGAAPTFNAGGGAVHWGVTIYLVDTPVALGVMGSAASGANITLPGITANPAAAMLLVYTRHSASAVLDMSSDIVRLPTDPVAQGTSGAWSSFGYRPIKGGETDPVSIVRTSGSSTPAAILFSFDEV